MKLGVVTGLAVGTSLGVGLWAAIVVYAVVMEEKQKRTNTDVFSVRGAAL